MDERKTSITKKRARKWMRAEYEGEFRIEHGTEFYLADGLRVAKEVGREWITLVPGWHVEDFWCAGQSEPGTLVGYDPDVE
jgi:hypothetical protein